MYVTALSLVKLHVGCVSGYQVNYSGYSDIHKNLSVRIVI